MRRPLFFLGLLLVAAASAGPSATVPSAAPTRVLAEQRPPALATRPPDATVQVSTLDPLVLKHLQQPVARDEATLDAARIKSHFPKVSGLDAIVLDSDRATSANPSSVLLDTHVLKTKLGVTSAMLYRDNQPTLDVTPATAPIELGPHDILAVRRNEPATVVARPGGGVIASSSTLLFANGHATNARALGLEYKSSDLNWAPDQAKFVGELLIGVVDPTDAMAQEQLNTAIPVQLVGPLGALDPTDFAIDHVGGPFLKVKVQSDGDEDPLKVQFRSRFDSQLPAADLHYIRPRLTFSAPATIPGLGFGFADVTVSAIGSPLRPGQTLTLDLDNGWMPSRTIVVDAHGVASTRVRSIGLGIGTLRLVPGVYVADPKPITFAIPWGFILATCLGAALGATVYVYRLRRKAPKSRRRYGMDWWAGLLIGIGVTVMAYAGMHLPEFIPMPVEFVGEAVPFALAFICAAIGSALIDAITGRGTEPKGQG